MPLTPETALRLHLAKAHELWLADRLILADAAMRQALRVGFAPGAQHDLQRTIEAELGARRAGRQWRIRDELVVEGDPARWGWHWRDITLTLEEALIAVTEALDVRWGKPVLVTLVPEEDWVEFMRARYGYYAERAETHKICLPPSALYPAQHLARAARHEMTHAAVHQLTGDAAPRWLDEGMAVMMEGGSPREERRRFRLAVRQGLRLSLDQVSGGFENWEVEIGSPRSLLSYAAAGDFVEQLARTYGLRPLRELLRRLDDRRGMDRAFRDVTGQRLRRVEGVWWKGLQNEERQEG